MRHLEGDSRYQTTLLPDSLDDYEQEDHPVRVIDAFINTLDLAELGFTLAVTKDTGRKPYHPGDLLKLYVYGYLNQARSSRRLEKECHRNLEVLWLLKRLAPDHKTIANFRQQNNKAIRGACREFIQFCREANVLTGALIAIDGSKFRAAASKSKAVTRHQLLEQRKRIDKLVDRYLARLAEADQADYTVDIDRQRVKRALQTLQSEQSRLSVCEEVMNAEGKISTVQLSRKLG